MRAMASPQQRQFLLGIIALVTVIECLVWAIYAAIYLYLRTGDPFGPVYTAEQLAQHNQVAWIATAMLLLNVVGTLAFFLRSRASGLPLLVAIQGANVVAIIVLRNLQGLDDWSGSLTLSVLPVFTVLLLAVLWRTSPPPLIQPKGGA